jgi:hypothetical protein
MKYIFISLIAIGLMYGIYYSGKPSNEVSAQIKMGCAEYAIKADTDQGSKQCTKRVLSSMKTNNISYL